MAEFRGMHRHPPVPLVVALILAILLAVAGWWHYHYQQGANLLASNGRIIASGTIEAEETVISAEIGGIIKDLPLDEGAEVQAGDVLVRLDDALITAQIRQAQAGVEMAQATLNQLLAGARAEEKKAARAALAQAIANRDGAKKALDNALAVRANPQELNMRIAMAKAEVEAARHQLQQAQAAQEAALANKERVAKALSELSKGFDIDTPAGKRHIDPPAAAVADLRTQAGLTTNQWWSAVEAVNQAAAALEGAERNLANLLNMRDDPIALDAQVDAAKAAYDAAVAAVDAAQARLDALEKGPTPEQIAVARAQVEQAQAALAVLEAQRAKLTIRSPISGLVTSRSAHVGEMAVPGVTLLTVAALDTVQMVVYIPEDQIGWVRLGQRVEVRVDSFPGQIFSGQVVYISPKAEFTPKNVQTQRERVNTVFAVRLKMPNPEHKLKPGMPADATIILQ